MVRITAKGYSVFSIGLDDDHPNNKTFAPGDTIIGHVSRKTPLVSPSANIKVALYGRTKGWVTVPNMPTFTIGAFTLLDEAANRQTILDGPIHIAPGHAAHKWSFAIDIPTHMCVKQVDDSETWGFATGPFDLASIEDLRLPGSFDTENSQRRAKQAFIEYYIRATIKYTEKGSGQTEELILPITIANVREGPPITDFQLARSSHQARAASFKLLPDNRNGGLSLTQRRRQLLRSSKVPHVEGQMEIVLPRLLQLDNPRKVPITMRFVPEDSFTSPELRGVPIQVELLRMEVTIFSNVRVRMAISDELMALLPPDVDEPTHVVLWPPRDGGSDRLYIPYGEDSPAVDVGERCGFRTRLFQQTAKARGGVEFAPDFETFNIQHTHYFRFLVEVGIADERIKLKLRGPVTILPPSDDRASRTRMEERASPARELAREGDDAPPPVFEARSESWIRPPAETSFEAPPSFAEVQAEDATRRSHDGQAGNPQP